MYESFIKDWLLNGQSRVYSVIVTTYRQKLSDLKPALFRKWLAKELDVPEDKINISSLHSALSRINKREKKNKQPGIVPNSSPSPNPAATTGTGFIFSNPQGDEQKRSTTKEY